jgi:hypothetical protein
MKVWCLIREKIGREAAGRTHYPREALSLSRPSSVGKLTTGIV